MVMQLAPAAEGDWTPVAGWLGREIGYSVPAANHYLLASACRDLLATHRFATPAHLVEAAGRDRSLRQAVINACTINESYFFRDTGLWEALRARVLPDLARETAYRGTVQVLCLACATGQEPYSLAMIWAELALPGSRLAITAADVDTAALERARAGVYSEFECQRGLDPVRRDRWFHRDPGGWRVRDELRAGIAFQPVNLAGEMAFASRFDLVMVRNVLIYFDIPDRRRVLERLAHATNGYGLLALGGSESTIGITDAWRPRQIGTYGFYEKRYAAGSP
jgi:chemotaxis protein methyltransferase CheR